MNNTFSKSSRSDRLTSLLFGTGSLPVVETIERRTTTAPLCEAECVLLFHGPTLAELCVVLFLVRLAACLSAPAGVEQGGDHASERVDAHADAA